MPVSHPRSPAARRAHVLELLPEAVLVLDESLRLVDSNGVAQRWLGLAPGADIDPAVHPDDRDVLVAAEAEVRRGGPGWQAPVPVRVRHADGTWHTWSVMATNRLDDPEVGGIVLLARDVSVRPQTGATPDVLLREVAAAAPVALLTVDLQGRIRFATGAGLVLDPQELVGRPLTDYLSSPEHRELLERALRGEQVVLLTSWGARWWEVRCTPLVHDGVLDGTVAVFLDVTDRTLAERALAASEAHLRGVLEAVREGIVVLDEDGRTTSANARAKVLLGEGAEVGGALVEAVEQSSPEAAEALRAVLGDSGPDRVELRLLDVHGTPVWLLASGNPLRSDTGERTGCVLVLTDITRNKDVERRLAAVARTDPVTGTGSRGTLAERLDQALARRGGSVTVLFVDVDGLKAVNDGHGHAAGDALLRAVAGRIRGALRPADTLVRYGGDEFVVVCDELPDGDAALELAERVRASVACPLVLPDDAVVVPTVSIGVATAPPLTGPGDLLAAADAAVLAAKRDGRDTVRVAPG